MERPSLSAVRGWALMARVHFGEGAVRDLGGVAAPLGRRAFLVTDPGVLGAGLSEAAEKSLTAAGVEAQVYDRVSPNPTDKQAAEGAEAYAESGADLLVALGGGSVIDAAKGIRLLGAGVGELGPFFADNPHPASVPTERLPPLVALPTTAGTGSEIAAATVLTDTAERRKRVIRQLRPTVTLIDPELTRSMPPALTAATGMDALSHCVEAYVSLRASPISDGTALEGARRAMQSLLVAVQDGDNAEARRGMCWAALLGGMTFGLFGTGLGATHTLSHPLSAQFDVPHGVANAVLLPAVMRFNLEAAADRYAALAKALAGRGEGEDAGPSAVALVEGLARRAGIPEGLRALGVQEDSLARLASQAVKDITLRTNPRPCGEEDLLTLYRAAL